MEEKNKNILLSFFEQLEAEEQSLLHDYLQDKRLESLSNAFDKHLEINNEVR